MHVLVGIFLTYDIYVYTTSCMFIGGTPFSYHIACVYVAVVAPFFVHAKGVRLIYTECIFYLSISCVYWLCGVRIKAKHNIRHCR